MNTLIKMAWRNIWRNKKRTVLTMSSITIAIFLSLFSRSLQKGTFGNMISNAVKFSSGYLQIQKKGYWEDKTIDETFEQTSKIQNLLEKNKNISSFLPRLESFALASSGLQTKGTMVIGTIPELEDQLNNYSKKIIKGHFISEKDNSIVIGDELASFMKVDVGDSLVLLGQGYHGITAAAKYNIKGILHLPIPQLNKQLGLLPFQECQYFYASENRLTSISLMLNDPELIDKTKDEINNSLNKNYAVMTWAEMNKELLQFVDTKNIGSIIMLAVLYIVIGFGVFGTIMMMTMERRKEFAIMVSIGMRKSKLLIVVFFETLFIGCGAIVLGILISYPVLLYLSQNPIKLSGEFALAMEKVGAEPILPFVLNSEIFIYQTLSVILIVMVAITYPLIFILKFDVLKAMKN
ncbi:MAG: ABC transporter permease [Ignavibacteriales bacterium]|nr:ABC transporter permease [Ignavibacteriales bacterium]